MNKIEREKINEQKAIELINKTDAINDIAIKAEPYVKAYWNMLKYLWTKPVGYKEAEMIKRDLVDSELKELNKKYRTLLK